MTIERTIFLYEILVRFGPDGYQGAHVIDLERVADGAEVIADREQPARSITEAEIGSIIGAENARLIEAADTAMAAKEAAVTAAAEATARAEAAEALVATLQAQLAAPAEG